MSAMFRRWKSGHRCNRSLWEPEAGVDSQNRVGPKRTALWIAVTGRLPLEATGESHGGSSRQASADGEANASELIGRTCQGSRLEAALLVLLARPARARVVAADLGSGAHERRDRIVMVVMAVMVMVMAAAARVVVSVAVGRLGCFRADLGVGAHRLMPSRSFSASI